MAASVAAQRSEPTPRARPRPDSVARFIDPETLTRISSLDLLAKAVVEGFISGLHRSPFLGRSMDFAEYRAYMPGDDIRQIDWKLYSRTDRYYVKQFEGDTNTNLMLLLDISKSMNFGTVKGASGPLTKLEYGQYLAASLGYFASRQRDRIGIVTFDDKVVDYIPAAAKHLNQTLLTINRIEPGGESELLAPLLKVTDLVRRRGMTVLISDLYSDPDTVLKALRGFKSKGHDLVVFHLLDPAELDFPYDEASDFIDLESGERQPIVPSSQKEKYLELIQGHVETLKRKLSELNIDYQLVRTSEPLDAALYGYLGRRLSAQKSQ
jgi:uncharacterized protein (DUF58 family)